MEKFCKNSAKSFVGKNVNLHLKNGDVIVNVKLTKIERRAFLGNVAHFVDANGKAHVFPFQEVDHVWTIGTVWSVNH